MNAFAQRLLNVARANRECPDPKRFDMRHFGRPEGGPSCAFGQYAARRDLQTAFMLNPCGSLCLADGTSVVPTPALREHLGITEMEFAYLFASNGCEGATTPEAAATVIERFVARKWPETQLDPAFVKLKGDLNEAAAVQALEHA